jgi:hypothetical protein
VIGSPDRSSIVRWAFLGLLVVHGLIHFMGFAHAFALAQPAQLSSAISRPLGVLWLGAGVAFLVTAVWLTVSPRTWWMGGLVAVALSQTAIGFAWGDARFGTIANVLILIGVAYGFASEGPGSLRARYTADVERRLATVASTAPDAVVTEADLAALPDPLRAYLRRSGAAGRPRPHHFAARWRGRIRSAPDGRWMEFTAEQTNFLDGPSRFFLMRAKRGGVPVDALHVYDAGVATMEVKLLSRVPVLDARGSDLGRAETVTVFNDLALMAPGGLLDPAIRWAAIDERSVRGDCTVGDVTVGAVLRFDEAGDLVDFVSDDRLRASPNGDGFEPQRWSTPVRAYRTFAGHRAMTIGEGRWHPPDGSYTYIELELVDLRIDADGDPGPR